MPSAKSAVIGNAIETSEGATCLAIENALNVSLTGSTPSDKGWGVEQVRDANGKIIEIIVFFDDKVPQSERAAALEKIKNNSGVATVADPERIVFENFDTAPLGLTQDVNPDPWNHVNPSDGSIYSNSGFWARADTRFNGASPGVSAAAINVVDSKAASAPNSLECTVDVTSGAYAGAYSFLAVNANSRTVTGWPTTPAPLSRLLMEIKFCSPLANGAVTAGAGKFLRFSQGQRANGFPLTHWSWVAPVDITTPPPVLPLELATSPTNGREWLLASGTASDVDLPMDGAFHTLRTELVQQTVLGVSGPVFSLQLDGGPPVLVQRKLADHNYLVNSLWEAWWTHGITSVPTGFIFSGAYSYIMNWDDARVEFTLA